MKKLVTSIRDSQTNDQSKSYIQDLQNGLQKNIKIIPCNLNKDDSLYACNTSIHDQTSHHKHILIDAVIKGNSMIVDETLKRYTLNHDQIRDPAGNSLVIIAVMNNNAKMTQLLVQRGVSANNPNLEGNTPLHFAISCGFKKCIDVLVENGANEKIKNNNGITPWEMLM